MRSRVAPLGLMVLLSGLGVSGSEPPARPPWEGNRVGVSDEVLPPWTPVVVAGDRVVVWGRTYRFGALSLPLSVTARGAEVLAGPIALTGEANGKLLAWTGGAAPVVEARPNRVKLAAARESAGLRCESETVVEYDGMVRCNVRLAPLRGKSRIERLALEIPFPAAQAAFLHTWPGRWGSAGNSAALPPDGFHGPFKPVRPGSDADIEVASRLCKTFDAFGRHEAAWLPYWGNAQYVRTSPAGVKVSLYNRPGRGLIAVVVNAGDRPCDAEVALDLAALEQPTSLAAHDILTDASLPLAAGKLSVPVGPMEYRVVWLRA